MNTATRRGTVTPMQRELARTTAAFASAMLVITGVCQILLGIAAVANDKIFVTGAQETYSLDVTAWGWIHVVVGACAIGTGCGALLGRWWARAGGVMVGVVGIMSNFLFLPYFPLWAIVLIAFYVFTIWALIREINVDD